MDSELVDAYRLEVAAEVESSDIEITLQGALPSTLTQPQVTALNAWMLADWEAFEGDDSNGRISDEYLRGL